MKKLLTTLLILLCITPVTLTKDYDIIGEARLYAAMTEQEFRDMADKVIKDAGTITYGPTHKQQMEAEKKKNAAKRQSATDCALARMIIVFPLMIVVGIGYWLIIKIKKK